MAIFYCANEKQDPIHIIKRKLEGFHTYMEVNACSITVLITHFTFTCLFCRITLQMIEQMLLGLEYDGILSGPSTKGFGYSLVRLVCSWFVL